MMDYLEFGDKNNPTVLLLHGAGALDTFRGQYCLADRYHLVVPHLQGAGSAADQPYEPEVQVNELFGLIDHLGKEQVGVIGHSLGAQIAVMLVSLHPERFSCGVFLSAWVNPAPKTVEMYCRLAGISAWMLHWGGLIRLQGKFWNYTKEQADFMAAYSRKITPQVYRAFFENTLNLKTLPGYAAVRLPMLAICGSEEVTDMKASLQLLGENPHCRTMILPKAGHDFPMRRPAELNPILVSFLEEAIP
ncbi:MAG: alpha/beta fold hydrolase [Faecousia sp.]